MTDPKFLKTLFEFVKLQREHMFMQKMKNYCLVTFTAAGEAYSTWQTKKPPLTIQSYSKNQTMHSDEAQLSD